MKVLPTKYAGILFRSRLEARWARFFDGLRIGWQYEPEAFRLQSGLCYTPDFYLPRFNHGVYAEVRPDGDDFDEPHLFALECRRPIWLCAGEPRCATWTVLCRAELAGAEHADLRIGVVEEQAIPLVGRSRVERRFFWGPGYEFTEALAHEMGEVEYLRAVEAARAHRFWTPHPEARL